MVKKRIVALLLAAVLCCACLVGCDKKKSDEELILDRVEAFLFAYNNGDFEGILNCLDSRSRNTFESLSGLFSTFTGYDVGAIFGDLFGVAVGFSSAEELLDVKLMELVVEDETHATVYTEMTYSDGYSEEADKVKFLLVKEEEDWFIRDLADYDELELESVK